MIATLFSVAFAAPVMAMASVSARDFQFPDSVPLDKRQTSGPKFECHSACGNAILQSQSSQDYCDSSEWVGLLDDCLDCALEFEIWQYYSPQLKPAAESCGLDATPKPVGGDSGGSTETTSTTAEAQSTSQAAATEVGSATEVEPEQSEATSEAVTEAAATTKADSGHSSQTDVVHTTWSTAEAEPEATNPAEHESHKPSDVAVPSPEETPVVAGASALELSQMIIAAGSVVAMMVNFH